MKNLFLLLLFLVSLASCTTQEKEKATTNEYTLVTYNVENLFDADGYAVFDDYKTTDRDGSDLYTKEDVLTKIQNAVQVLKEYNEGKGPDIAVMVELESDFTPNGAVTYADAGDFLGRFAHTTLEKMLGVEFDDQVADLPSEWLLLKGMVDAGMWNYQVEVGHSEKNDQGLPSSVQKTAIFSRFPIKKEKTKIHPLVRARPILETWIDVDGNELAVFANHWKSGASSWEMEQVRFQNAEVLRARLDELTEENPAVDFVLAGDFNSDYNQKERYEFEKTALDDVLGSSDNKNLWYDFPLDQRGSDTYRGYWGTLMQIMVSNSLMDDSGLSYVNNSFNRGSFEYNTHSSSGEPNRWSSNFTGSGYSDHLPISMKFKKSEGLETNGFSTSVTEEWKPIPVSYNIPTEFLTETEFMAGDPTTNPDFFNEYFYLTGTVTDKYDFTVNGTTYDVYTPSFRLNEVLSEIKGTDKKINFYGRFSQYRGNWQFVVEDPSFIVIQE